MMHLHEKGVEMELREKLLSSWERACNLHNKNKNNKNKQTTNENKHKANTFLWSQTQYVNKKVAFKCNFKFGVGENPNVQKWNSSSYLKLKCTIHGMKMDKCAMQQNSKISTN